MIVLLLLATFLAGVVCGLALASTTGRRSRASSPTAHPAGPTGLEAITSDAVYGTPINKTTY
ncbi:hypothetical protein EDD28_0023 [Salana multivorans]|uniref:Uncharacterized protein n=1 Tax=Salana multivorans TaxID=120377 RepID=A0A3N2D6R7_9MICO|nr:hypothetical protein [Salana multivorans]ROR93076.1 hypothetical protein EDD28_2481 [Salana multivorans]ROR95470.1 hypothetical protein EDD28_0023 [Salana multivorans]